MAYPYRGGKLVWVDDHQHDQAAVVCNYLTSENKTWKKHPVTNEIEWTRDCSTPKTWPEYSLEEIRELVFNSKSKCSVSITISIMITVLLTVHFGKRKKKLYYQWSSGFHEYNMGMKNRTTPMSKHHIAYDVFYGSDATCLRCMKNLPNVFDHNYLTGRLLDVNILYKSTCV